MYDGPDAKPGWLPLGKFVCTSSAVKAGLLPPLRPIWDLHLRDTVICVGGDGLYYMTGSTGDNIWDRNDGIELYRSKDLQHWDYLGLVWSFDKDAHWQKQWRKLKDKPARDIWAPELHYLKHKKAYVLAYSLAGGAGTGILLGNTGKPEGPYTSPLKPDARLTGGIDPTIFEDDDGKVYLTWGRGGQIAQLKDDLSEFEIPPRNVIVDKSDATAADGTTNVPADLRAQVEVAFEGASLFKHNGKYHLGGAVFWGGSKTGRYSSVDSVADTIWGPYKHWHEAVACGGGTNYFQDNAGIWWCCYFGNDEQSPYREKPGLVRIDFDKDDNVIVADEQPAFVLQPGAATKWRNAMKP
jgi:beta-xylosidase